MDLQDIMRKFFRISVKDIDDVSIRISNAPYDVIDVGDNGIGIRLSPEDIFVAVEDEMPVVPLSGAAVVDVLYVPRIEYEVHLGEVPVDGIFEEGAPERRQRLWRDIGVLDFIVVCRVFYQGDHGRLDCFYLTRGL